MVRDKILIDLTSVFFGFAGTIFMLAVLVNTFSLRKPFALLEAAYLTLSISLIVLAISFAREKLQKQEQADEQAMQTYRSLMLFISSLIMAVAAPILALGLLRGP
jgi:hypothetical protein